jgi:glutamate-1-semialdehyde 2,1-aminomutase
VSVNETSAAVAHDDSARLDELIEEQERIFLERQPASTHLMQEARRFLAGGVTCSWQSSNPQPVYVSHGEGAYVYDVDGNSYVDFHAGYGVTIVGHGHPAIVRAVSERIARGSHFCQPTEDAVVVARELARRFGLPSWRFSNSGTEATMDAVHLMRAATGRWKIAKVEGGYHGHHDSLMVSIYEEGVDRGPADRPRSIPSYAGVPQEIVELTVVVPFNDLDAVEAIFAEHDGEIAGLIVEPLMMNIGIVPPVDGFLEGVRDIARRHGALLAFDEVKTGVTVAPGGATELFGVTPDIVCLAKAIGGGTPCGAIGGTEDVMDVIATDRLEQEGTFNGNPLTMAAARAALLEVLDDAAYERVRGLCALMVAGCRRTIQRWQLPAYVQGFGAKGALTFSPTRVRNFRDYFELDHRYAYCHWLFQHNHGVFLTPWGGEWTVSVRHTDEDAMRYVSNFETFVRALRA